MYKALKPYYKAIDQQKSPFVKAIFRTQADKTREQLIHYLLCHLALPIESLPLADFAKEWVYLKEFEQMGLLSITPKGIEVNGVGQIFIRNIAQIFDSYNKISHVNGFSNAI